MEKSEKLSLVPRKRRLFNSMDTGIPRKRSLLASTSFMYILSSPDENICFFCWGYIPIKRIPFSPNHHKSYPWPYHILSLCLFGVLGTSCCPNSQGVSFFQVGSSPMSHVVPSSWLSFLNGWPYIQINIQSHMSLTSKFSFPKLVRLPYPRHYFSMDVLNPLTS